MLIMAISQREKPLKHSILTKILNDIKNWKFDKCDVILKSDSLLNEYWIWIDYVFYNGKLINGGKSSLKKWIFDKKMNF